MEKNFPILYYHFIKSPDSKTRIKGLFTNEAHFEWQLKQLIKNGFNFITFEDIAKKRFDITKRNLILTFDDGCESLYENAFPILKKYGVKAVVYVVTESIGARSIVWEQNEFKEPLNILTEKQILEMAKFGIEFGSHACNHVHLPQLSSENLKNELINSKLILEKLLKLEIYSVAYPYGSYDKNVLELASEAGYKFGVTTKKGDNTQTGNLELNRVAVKGHALRHYWYFYKLLRREILNKDTAK